MRRLGWNPRPATQRSTPLRPEGLSNAAAGGLLLLLLSTGLLKDLLSILIPGNWTAAASAPAIQALIHTLGAISGALFVGGLLHAGWEAPDQHGAPRLDRQAPPLPRGLRWKLYAAPLIISLALTLFVLNT